MEFYTCDILSDPSISFGSLPVTASSPASSSATLQLSLVDYHHHITFPTETFYGSQTLPGGNGKSSVRAVVVDSIPQFSSTNTSSSSSPSQSPHLQHLQSVNDSLGSSADAFSTLNDFKSADPSANKLDRTAKISGFIPTNAQNKLPQLPQPSLGFNHQESIPQLQFQLENRDSNLLASEFDSVCGPRRDPTSRSDSQLNLSAHEISDSILNPAVDKSSICLEYPLGAYNQNLNELQFQSTAAHPVFIGFNPSETFGGFQNDTQSADQELEAGEGRINSSPIAIPQSNTSHESQARTQLQSRLSSWHNFSSPTSVTEDEQRPVSPTDIAQNSPNTLNRGPSMHFTSPRPLLYEYPSQTSSAMPLNLEISHSFNMMRSGSNASEFSDPSPVHSLGVNPIHVNPLSQPATPQDDFFGPLGHPFKQSWWISPNDAQAVDSLVTNVKTTMALSSPTMPDNDESSRVAAVFPCMQQLPSPTSAAGKTSPQRSSPYHLAKTTVNCHQNSSTPTTRRRSSHRSALSMLTKSTSSRPSSRPFLVEPDYSRLPTKRSRGRRPPISPDLGLPIPDGNLLIGLQSVPGGQAFDPNLNPNAETVKYCELTKTGKPKKIFICQVKGCGKCFKRSEHLKRHVRSIHTNDKPYNCPWIACMKSFSRHDNLNQHLRVHRVEDGGEVLNGLHIGSDGVLRLDLDESPVDPASRGLRNVEVIDRYLLEE